MMSFINFVAVYCFQGAMSNDQVRQVEVIVDGVIQTNNPVFYSEASLPLAKDVQGLRACFDEVHNNVWYELINEIA